jgi:hypothetical protein
MFPRIGNYHQRHAVFLLQTYSHLHLTQESDILIAATGLLRALEQGCPGFRHCWGVPVLEDFFINEKYGKKIAPRAEPWVLPLVFLLGLSWRHIRHQRGTIPRRPGFPSWSWTGWRAPVAHFPWLDYRGNGEPGGSGVDLSELVFSKDIDVKVETCDGTILTWDEYLQIDPTRRQTELSRFLHITAWTTPVHIRPGHEATGKYNEEPDITLNVEKTSAYELVIRYPDPSRLPTEGYILHLPQHHWRRSDFLVIGLIDGVCERLAMDNGPDEGIGRNWDSMEKTLQTIRLG